MTKKELAIRQAVADLIQASGCSCCRDDGGWYKAQENLATLLAVPLYKDSTDRYEFNQFSTKPV